MMPKRRAYSKEVRSTSYIENIIRGVKKKYLTPLFYLCIMFKSVVKNRLCTALFYDRVVRLNDGTYRGTEPVI